MKNKMFKSMGGNIPGGNFMSVNFPEGVSCYYISVFGK